MLYCAKIIEEQRQAVPLMITDAPVVGTGIEAKAAVDSGVCVVAKKAGTISYSCSNEIRIGLPLASSAFGSRRQISLFRLPMLV